MLKQKLMLGAAFAALSLLPLSTSASASEGDNSNETSISNSWDNSIDVELSTTIDVYKSLNITGNINIDGNVRADALSMATLDDKQLLNGNSIQFEDYGTPNSHSQGVSAEPGLGQTSASPFFSEEGLPHPATYSNTASVGNATLSAGSGNIGLNIAAGDYNLQENAAVISSAEGLIPARTITSTDSSASGSAFANNTTTSNASATNTTTSTSVGTATTTTSTNNSGSNVHTDLSSGTSTDTETSTQTNTNTAYLSGAAEASSYSLQDLQNTEFNTETYATEHSVITNTASIGNGTLNGATGNIGVNIAAGAFNIQKNALVIATIRGGNLAEATAGTIQHSLDNETVVETVTNNATLGASLIAATGNIGVNPAAGVGNLQLNTLTIASALLPTGTGTGTAGGGGAN